MNRDSVVQRIGFARVCFFLPNLITTVYAIILGFAIPSGLADLAVGQTLQIGAARVDITPTPEMKASLGGYGARMGRPAEGVHDRVFAKALVVRQGGKKFALITADILAFPPGFKARLVERLALYDWTRDQLLLLPSHSHTSIDMTSLDPRFVLPIPQLGQFNQQVFDMVLTRLEGVLREAESSLGPAKVGVGACRLEGWVRNRRRSDGFTSPQCTVVRIDTVEGRPLAAVVHFTAHPTILLPEHMYFSGDWPGHLQRTLEALIGPGTTVLFVNGALGDQAPVLRPDSGYSRWEASERYGRELAIEAHRVWGSIIPSEEGTLTYCWARVDLPELTWHPKFQETGGTEYGLTQTLLKQFLPLIFPRQTAVAGLKLGSLTLIGMPGEPIGELGRAVADYVKEYQTKLGKAETEKGQNPGYIIVAGLADEWISYVLTAEEYHRGGYESSVSFYGPDLGAALLRAAKQVAQDLTLSEVP